MVGDVQTVDAGPWQQARIACAEATALECALDALEVTGIASNRNAATLVGVGIVAPSVAAVAAQARALDAPMQPTAPAGVAGPSMWWHPLRLPDALTCFSRVVALVLGVAGLGAPLLLVSVRASVAGTASALRGSVMHALTASLGLHRSHVCTWWRPLDHSGRGSLRPLQRC